MKKMLYASFAKPVGMFDNIFNKVVAFCTGGHFCHSEFIFVYEKETFETFLNNIEDHDKLKKSYNRYVEDDKIKICFYVLWGDKVKYRLLKDVHNNPFYRMPNSTEFDKIHVQVSDQEEEKLINFLFDQCGKNYDYEGALGFFIPFRYNRNQYDKYFCSQLMVSALHQIQMYREYNAAGITPNYLHKILTT